VATVDVVVVSYNSRAELRRSVEPLSESDDLRVIVVDNASGDRSLEVLEGLRVDRIALGENRGFGYGCNVGWRAGEAPYVLFLNPDASIGAESIRTLVGAVEQDEHVGAAAPLVRNADGSVDHSLRRFPRLASTYAQAVFAHRVLPGAQWTGEVIRDERAYTRPGCAEWVSGACVLVRRSVLELLDGFDEGFFLYCEDKDLCRRIWDAGFEVYFEPDAVCVHAGGASAPRPQLLPVLAASRIRYARKHRGRLVAQLERGGVALGALTHVVAARGGAPVRAGHSRALRRALARDPV
jgi:hypothetical protein